MLHDLLRHVFRLEHWSEEVRVPGDFRDVGEQLRGEHAWFNQECLYARESLGVRVIQEFVVQGGVKGRNGGFRGGVVG